MAGQLRKDFYCDFMAAGASYYQNEIEAAGLEIGQPVRLVRDPWNKYDHNAVKIIGNRKTMIGHVPAGQAEQISAALAAGQKYKAEIVVLWEGSGGLIPKIVANFEAPAAAAPVDLKAVARQGAITFWIFLFIVAALSFALLGKEYGLY